MASSGPERAAGQESVQLTAPTGASERTDEGQLTDRRGRRTAAVVKRRQ
jgi:hypothetical protein